MSKYTSVKLYIFSLFHWKSSRRTLWQNDYDQVYYTLRFVGIHENNISENDKKYPVINYHSLSVVAENRKTRLFAKVSLYHILRYSFPSWDSQERKKKKEVREMIYEKTRPTRRLAGDALSRRLLLLNLDGNYNWTDSGRTKMKTPASRKISESRDRCNLAAERRGQRTQLQRARFVVTLCRRAN